MYLIRHTYAKSLICPSGTDCLNKHGEYTSETSCKLHAKPHTLIYCSQGTTLIFCVMHTWNGRSLIDRYCHIHRSQYEEQARKHLKNDVTRLQQQCVYKVRIWHMPYLTVTLMSVTGYWEKSLFKKNQHSRASFQYAVIYNDDYYRLNG